MSTAATADTPIFEATLTPYRSLSKRGAVWLVGVIAAIWGLMSLSFLAIGAWPVLAFFGLDIVLFGWLIWLNVKDARRKETVLVSRTALEVKRFCPNGLRREFHRYNPFGTRLAIDRHQEYGVTRLSLITNGKPGITVGDFLNPDDKESFAKALVLALAKARGR
ncbi:MAG: DUF2244 domain-containing protein [Notoacmeibacter sp.]